MGEREEEWLSPCTALITTHEENCPLFYILQNLTEIHTLQEINRLRKGVRYRERCTLREINRSGKESKIERKILLERD
jgi:hypothetical protein